MIPPEYELFIDPLNRIFCDGFDSSIRGLELLEYGDGEGADVYDAGRRAGEEVLKKGSAFGAILRVLWPSSSTAVIGK
jgi:hypothetical protein